MRGPILGGVSVLPLLAAAAFALADPAGDAHGDGSYVLPTHPTVNADALDLREFGAQDAGDKMRFTVGFGAVSNPWHLSSGYSDGVTDIFVKTGLGGSYDLTGLNLRTAGAGGWEYHLRVSGAGAQLEQFVENGTAPAALPTPQVTRQGTTLVIDSAIPAGQYGYWVTSSVYTPLSADGLLQPTTQAGPGNLQAARAGAPVPVDVLAPASDYSAYQTHELAPAGQSRDLRVWSLGALGGAGLLLTLLATWQLRRTGRFH